MAKVLFVLYVPEDVSTTPGISRELGKDGKKEVGSIIKVASEKCLESPADLERTVTTLSTGTENDRLQVRDSNANSQAGISLLGTSEDSKVKNEAALNITSSCKASESCLSISAVQVIVSTQKEKDSSQDSLLSNLDSAILPETEPEQTADNSEKSHLMAVADLSEFLPNGKDAEALELDTEHSTAAIQSQTEEDERNVPLKKFTVGENLTDDFWDFGPEEQTEAVNEAEPKLHDAVTAETTESGPQTDSSENHYSEKNTTKASYSPGRDKKAKVDQAFSDEEKSPESSGITPLKLVLNAEDKAKGGAGFKKTDENRNALEDLAEVGIPQPKEEDQAPAEKAAPSTSGTGPGTAVVVPQEAVTINPVPESSAPEMIELVPQRPLKEQVVDCLGGLRVKNVAWAKCQKDRVWQASFIDSAGMRCEDILHTLEGIGLGVIKRSSISVIPISIHSEETDNESSVGEAEIKAEDEKQEKIAEEKIGEFQKSIKSRMVVAQVVESVRSNAEFTFDYVMLVIVASLIAALGLIEDSSIVLVASMLISPLMGPILAGTFGIVIKNHSLRDCGIRSELCGLAIAIVSGFVCGLIVAGAEVSGLPWRETEKWPTDEMSSRGVFRGLLIGALIALPSGAGVALSVLGGNTGSLVGVAISASLLPPAVNAGMLWSTAILFAIVPPERKVQNETFSHAQGMFEKPRCPELVRNDYTQVYVCDTSYDFALLGGVSLLLTVVNIICIFFMGIMVLKVKEVAPRTSFTNTLKQFFKHDIKVARESYTTAKGPQSAALGRKWLEEYKKLKENYGVTRDDAEEDAFCDMLEHLDDTTDVQAVLGFLPKGPGSPVFVPVLPAFDPSAPNRSKHFTVTRVKEAGSGKMHDSHANIREVTSEPPEKKIESKPGPAAGRKGRTSIVEETEPLMKVGRGGKQKAKKSTKY